MSGSAALGGAAAGAATGAKIGSFFPGIGNIIGGVIGGALGGISGAMKGRKLPTGVMSGTAAGKLFKKGLSVDEILAQGPVGTFHPGKSLRHLVKLGIPEQDAYRLLASSGVSGAKLARAFPELAKTYEGSGIIGVGGPGIGSQYDGGAGQMAAFQSLMPTVLNTPGALQRPEAAQWLQSLFAPQQPTTGSSVPMPFEGGLGALGSLAGGIKSGGYTPWVNPSAPGPDANPLRTLQAFSGPFGNGGGALVPTMSFNRPKGGQRPQRR